MKEKVIVILIIVAAGVGLAWLTVDSSNRGDNKDAIPGNRGMVTTPSGLQYEDLTIGTGTEARAGKSVTVHYTGTLKNGTMFDSSRGKRPFTFPLGTRKVIRGWDEGVAGMKEGGKRKLIIPPELGYGARGAGDDIPPNSELHFEVELLKVN